MNLEKIKALVAQLSAIITELETETAKEESEIV